MSNKYILAFQVSFFILASFPVLATTSELSQANLQQVPGFIGYANFEVDDSIAGTQVASGQAKGEFKAKNSVTQGPVSLRAADVEVDLKFFGVKESKDAMRKRLRENGASGAEIAGAQATAVAEFRPIEAILNSAADALTPTTSISKAEPIFFSK